MKEGKHRLRFKISDQVHTYNVVVNSLCHSGFAQTEGSLWNVLWSAPLKPECLRAYDKFKKCNHFPGTFQFGRKDNMYRHVSRMIREFGEEYRIVPKTWIFPEDLRRFQKEREDTTEAKLWILKPANSACGRGIRILTKNSGLPKKGQFVACEYIMRPHLLNGFKYDLRLYVFITSYEPLTIYLYREGLVRFATQPYSTKNTKTRFAHLTNFSVNKKAASFRAAEDGVDDAGASKWSLKGLQAAFKELGIDYEAVFVRVKDLVVKAVLSVEPVIANNMQRASRNRHLCFELYGFDVILDADLRPWLLEVNVLPSLSSGAELDKRIKTALLTDVFSTVGVVPYNKKKVLRELEAAKWEKFSGIQAKPAPRDVDESCDLGLQPPSKIRPAKELAAATELNEEEQTVIIEKLEEQSRCGDFERVFPLRATVDQYQKYFKAQRAPNLIWWRWLKLKREEKLAWLKDFKPHKNQAELLCKLLDAQ